MHISNTKDELFVNLVLKTTKDLYQKFGYKKVTMDDVAREVGKTRSALYYYFKNRDELFEAVLFSLVDEVKAELLDVMAAESALDAKLNAFCVVKINGSKLIQAFYSALESSMNRNEQSKYAQLKWQVHQKMMATEIGILRDVVHVAIGKGEIPAQTEEQLQTVLFVFLGGIRGIRRELAIDAYSKYWEAGVTMLVRMVIAEFRR